jgi:hypothetical protein
MNEPKPVISTGSLLNTSEGLLSTGVLAALTTSLTTSEDWRVQAASAIGLAILGAAYVVSRTLLKRTETEVGE